MIYYSIKIAISAIIIVAVSELAKRNTLMGGLLASVPLVSVLAMIWLHIETQDLQKISSFSYSVFWLVIPSLILFISFPVLVKQGLNFYASLGIAITLTVVAYYLMIYALKRLGLEI